MTTTLTADQQALLPTADDVADYREHGFWISPVILPPEILDGAERGMDRYYAGDHDTPVEGWTPPTGPGLRKDDYTSLHVAELAALVSYPLLAASAAVLAGADGIRLWHDQLLYKPVDAPGVAGNVGWHTDRQYWQTCSSEQMLTAWVGFHDVEPEGGSVGFVDGSHRLDVDGLDFFSQDLAGLEASVRDRGHPWTVRPTTLRRGQVSFHHCRTVHGSGPNRGERPRRALAVHLQPADNRWRRHTRPDGTVSAHGNDGMVRRSGGVPDYADPRVCPTLWPPAGPSA